MSTAELDDRPQLEAGTGTAAPAAGVWLPPRLAWYAVTMISLVTLCGQLDYGLISLLVQPIKKSTHMTDIQISLLQGWAYSLPYLACGIPLAWLSDRTRRTYVLSSALTVWSVGTALCGFAGGFWPFAASRGVMGGAISVKGPTTVSVIPDLVPRDKLGRAFGIYNICLTGGQYLSSIVGALLLGWLLHLMPFRLFGLQVGQAWQMVFILMAVPGLLLAPIVALSVPEPMRHGVPKRPTNFIEELRSLLKVLHFVFVGPAAKVYVPLIIGALMGGVLLAGYGGWRAAFFDRTYHMPAHIYGVYSGTLGLISAPIGVVIGAWLAEKMHRRWIDSHLRLTAIAHALMMPIYIFTPLLPNAALALSLQFVMGILLLAVAPSQLAAMQIITPSDMRARVNALYMITISVVGNGAGPMVVALMTKFLFHSEAHLGLSMMTLAAICTPVSLVCMILAVKPYGRLHRQVLEAERVA